MSSLTEPRTLPSDQIIPAGVALRLHRIYFGIDHDAAARAQRPALTEASAALTKATGSRDDHAAMADCAALADYMAAHGSIDLTVREDTRVVPWAYRRHHPDTAGRPCWNCGGSGVRCCEFASDR